MNQTDSGMVRYGRIVLDEIGHNPKNPAGLPAPSGFDPEDLAAITRVVPVVLRLPSGDDVGHVEWAWRGQSFTLGGNLGIYRSDGARDTLAHHLDEGMAFEWVEFKDSNRFAETDHPELDQ